MKIKNVLLICLIFAAGIVCADDEDTVLEKVQFKLKEKGISTETTENVSSQLKLKLKLKSASEIDEEAISDQLADCLKDNYSPDDAVKISLKVREMTKEGSPQEKRQMKIMVNENLAESVGADNILSSLEILKIAVEKGYSPFEARLKISLAVHDAKAEGLKGQELAQRIHEIHEQIKDENKNSLSKDKNNSSKIQARNKEGIENQKKKLKGSR